MEHNMRNKIYSKRRRKLHSLFNQVLKNTFIDKLIHKNQLINNSEIDFQTGLYNHLAINNYLKELYPQSESPFGIILLSVDNFNEIKTNHRLKTANKALVSIANELSLNIRETDLIGRYSESEFILILNDVTLEQALHISKRLSSLINAQSLKINNKTISLKVSCGVAVSEIDTMSNAVLQQADQALYMARTSNNHFYTGSGMSS